MPDPLIPGIRLDAKVCQQYSLCVKAIVLDSSAIITFARVAELDLLQLWSGSIWTIPEVYQETVDAGLVKGYPDAISIQKSFRDGIIQIKNPRKRERLAGVSLTDSLVIMLAAELHAAFLLVNDHALLRRAEGYGVSAQFSAEFIRQLCEEGKISNRRMMRIYRALHEAGRYTEEFLNALVTR